VELLYVCVNMCNVNVEILRKLSVEVRTRAHAPDDSQTNKFFFHFVSLATHISVPLQW
jgi:hypothetical protein